MIDVSKKRVLDWIKAAGYCDDLFAAQYAEEDKRLEDHFTSHTGYFEECDGPVSTIVLGARGSGKTANCQKLAEKLSNARAASNFVLRYDPSILVPMAADSYPPDLEYHMHVIIRLGAQELLKSAPGRLAAENRVELERLSAECQHFCRWIDYRSKLQLLQQHVLRARYAAFYLLIDERHSPQREPARARGLLLALLHERLFNIDRLYVKLFLPDVLIQSARELHQGMGEQVQIACLEWSESDLAELLRSMLQAAWQADSYGRTRAEELSRLAILIPEIDREFVRAVVTNAATPRSLIHLGQNLFRQCASHWEPGQIISITPQDWATARKEWHQSLSVEKRASRPAELVPLKIQFDAYQGRQVKVTVSTYKYRRPHPHKIVLPYTLREVWAVLWALEQFALGVRQLPAGAPHIGTLRKLGLIQADEKAAGPPALAIDIMERVGERLYYYLFEKSGLGHYLEEARERVDQLRDKGIQEARVWLELCFEQRTLALARFPWELLRQAGVFLFQTGVYELSRYYGMENERASLQLSRPLKLVYIAPRNNSNDVSYDLPRICQAFQPDGQLELQEVTPPSFERLQQETCASHYQAFHYDGHGTLAVYCPECRQFFPPWTMTCPAKHSLAGLSPQGYLQFEDGSGQMELRPASDLLHALYQAGSCGLQFALVDACKSSAQADRPSFGGVASALLRAGLPAVVGMLSAIEDKAAGAFVEGFYATLAAALQYQGQLTGQEAGRVLLQAVCEGRKRMLGQAGHSSGQRCWYIPTLNLSYDTGGKP